MLAKLALLIVSAAALASAAKADVSISNKATANMGCVSGVCSPTAPDAVLNVTDLANMLATGDVMVATGSGAVNIDVVAPLSWTSTSRLTLNANTNLNIQSPMTVAGTGALALTYNDGGSNGDLIFSNGGNATFANLTSSLIINGSSYKLFADLAALAHAINNQRGTHFALASDYDASVNGAYKNSPIKKSEYPTLEGLGHTISNLTIAEDGNEMHNCVGLFSHIYKGGMIRDLSLSAANISSTTASALGALVGCGAGDIVHVSVDGSVQGMGTGAFGGVIGSLGKPGSVSFVTSAANVTNEGFASQVGGIAGDSSGAISHFRASGSVVGGQRSAIGGLVGEMHFGGRVSFRLQPDR